MQRGLSITVILWLAAGPTLAQERGVVAGLELVHGEAPAPRVGVGAPMYSPEQTASYLCVALSSGVGVAEAQAAHEATVKARQVRLNAFNGAATRAEMAAAERVRQEAVLKMLGDDVLDASFRSIGALFSRGGDDPTAERDGVVIDQVRTERTLESGRAVLNISGRARNTGKAAIDLPPVAVRARDANGFMVAGQSHVLDKESLAPGEETRFAIRFKNPPAYTAKVDVRFSDLFETRNFRGCDFFDPVSFDAKQVDVAQRRVRPVAPMPRVGQGAPAYTPAELAAVFPRLMRDSQTEFQVSRTPRACSTDPPPTRQTWRILFKQADLAYEAWVTTYALDELRRDAAEGPVPSAELQQAELQRQAAVNAFVAARPPRLPAQADPAPFTLAKIAFTPTGEQVTVSGEIVNVGGRLAQPHGLLITVIDRFGHVVTEVPRDPAPPIAPGASLPFSIPLTVRPALAADVNVAFRTDPPPRQPSRKRSKDPCA